MAKQKRGKEQKKEKKTLPSPSSSSSLLLVSVFGALLVGVVAFIFVGSGVGENRAPVGVVEKVDIPSFSLKVCRFKVCEFVNVTEGLAFSGVRNLMKDTFPGLKGYIHLTNQTGDSIENVEQLFDASEIKADSRGLTPMWRGVRVLVGDERFFWPVPQTESEVGAEFRYTVDGHTFGVKSLYSTPRIFELVDFLSEEECDYLIGRAMNMRDNNHFVESSIGGDDASKQKTDQRTSTQTWIGPGQSNDDEIFLKLRTRAAKFLKLDLSVAEDTQVVHYDEGQYYQGHHDYTPADSAPGNKYFAGGGNRIATVLYYLSDVEAGGDTRFPFAQETHPVPLDRSWGLYNGKACNVGGLEVLPKKGKAVLFYSLKEEGHMNSAEDITSLHAACPLISGEKWLANQWFRNKRVKVGSKWNLYDNHW